MQRNFNLLFSILAVLITLLTAATPAQPQKKPRLSPPVEDGPWIRPAAVPNAEPIWGIKGGIAIGLWPMRGPRGLLRIYAPYLGQERPRMINFISVEPVVEGKRGQSELEHSDLDNVRGKAMWTTDALDTDAQPRSPTEPARGKIVDIDGTKALTFFVVVEKFHNGAAPIIQVTLRQDRPREVSLKVFAGRNSSKMQSCVLSATMGNYARLRHLWLRGEVVDSRLVWPKFTPDRLNFAPWRSWPVERMVQVNGDAIVAATPSEKDPAKADYMPKVAPHWKYEGKWATQYWRSKAVEDLVVRVNGRITYWGESGPIPGGISYENFEMEAPFEAGQEFRFGVTTEPPEKLGFDARWGKNLTDGVRK